MDIKYTNIFHCKTLQNFPKLGFLVWKYAIWQPSMAIMSFVIYHLGIIYNEEVSAWSQAYDFWIYNCNGSVVLDKNVIQSKKKNEV
jgi:hypothetical protein